MTHTELVMQAERWLRNILHCRGILVEFVASTLSRETPDVIGWVHGRSILVEVKTSHADFLADLKKESRRGDLPALGDWRFYLTPPRLLRPEEIPIGWGLYEVHGKRVIFSGGEEYRNAAAPPCQSCLKSEQALLISALARKGKGMKTFTRKGYGRIYVDLPTNVQIVEDIIYAMDAFEFEYLPDNFVVPFREYPIVVYTHKFDALDINQLTAHCWKRGIHIFCFDNGVESFVQNV